jgi:hypothetical protein
VRAIGAYIPGKRTHDAGRRFTLAAAACVVASLGLASTARALPLASAPAASPSTCHPLESTTTPAISVWNFVHPGSAEQAELVAEAPPVPVASSASATESRWVTGPETSDHSYDGAEARDDDSWPTGPGPNTAQYSHGGQRSLRQSSSGQRSVRPDSRDYPAAEVRFSAVPPPPTQSVAVGGDQRSDHRLTSRLFRPPRVENRLP